MKRKNVVKNLLTSAIAIDLVLDKGIDSALKLLVSTECTKSHINEQLDRLDEKELVANMEFCAQVASLMHDAMERRRVGTKCS